MTESDDIRGWNRRLLLHRLGLGANGGNFAKDWGDIFAAVSSLESSAGKRRAFGRNKRLMFWGLFNPWIATCAIYFDRERDVWSSCPIAYTVVHGWIWCHDSISRLFFCSVNELTFRLLISRWLKIREEVPDYSFLVPPPFICSWGEMFDTLIAGLFSGFYHVTILIFFVFCYQTFPWDFVQILQRPSNHMAPFHVSYPRSPIIEQQWGRCVSEENSCWWNLLQNKERCFPYTERSVDFDSVNSW